MTIKLGTYKGMQVVEEKTGQSSYLAGTPVFQRSDVTINDVPINPALETAFNILSKDDGDPYWFITEMKLGEEFPTAYGDIMTVDWANSFIEKLSIAPFPMSALGHTSIDKPFERVESHGYVFGGKVLGDSLFLRNYLRAGMTDQSKEFINKTIQEMQSGMLSTSISNVQKFVRVEDEKNPGNFKWYVVESIQGQRNDIVEHDLVGSEAAIVARSFKSGKQADDSANKPKEKSMTPKEMLKNLRTLKGNGEMSNAELAEALGLELVSKEHVSAVASLKAIQAEAGEGADVIALIKGYKTLKSELETAGFSERKSASLKEVFKDHEAVLEAIEVDDFWALKSGDAEACKAEAERIFGLKTIKDLASKMASDMSKGASFKTEGKVQDSNEPIKM